MSIEFSAFDCGSSKLLAVTCAARGRSNRASTTLAYDLFELHVNVKWKTDTVQNEHRYSAQGQQTDCTTNSATRESERHN